MEILNVIFRNDAFNKSESYENVENPMNRLYNIDIVQLIISRYIIFSDMY